MFGQLFDGVGGHFLSDTVTFKSQDTIDCETVSHVPDWVPRHDYLRPAIVEEF